MNQAFYVYILARRRNGTLYIGVTHNLVRRMFEHKARLVPGFTQQYKVDRLLYFEQYDSILEARARDEALASRMENRTHRKNESGLARPEW